MTSIFKYIYESEVLRRCYSKVFHLLLYLILIGAIFDYMFYDPKEEIKYNMTKIINKKNFNNKNKEFCYIILDGMRYDTFKSEMKEELEETIKIRDRILNGTYTKDDQKAIFKEISIFFKENDVLKKEILYKILDKNNKKELRSYFYECITNAPTSTTSRLAEMVSGKKPTLVDLLNTFEHNKIFGDNLFLNLKKQITIQRILENENLKKIRENFDFFKKYAKTGKTKEFIEKIIETTKEDDFIIKKDYIVGIFGDSTILDLIGNNSINKENKKKFQNRINYSKFRNIEMKELKEKYNLNAISLNKAYSPSLDREKEIMIESLLTLNLIDLNFIHLNVLDSYGHKFGVINEDGDYVKKYINVIKLYKSYLKLVLLLNEGNKSYYITSDHGVNNDGGHGGFSFIERRSFLFLIKNNCSCLGDQKIEKISQNQILHTLSKTHSIQTPEKSLSSLIYDEIYCRTSINHSFNKIELKKILAIENIKDNVEKVCKISLKSRNCKLQVNTKLKKLLKHKNVELLDKEIPEIVEILNLENYIILFFLVTILILKTIFLF